jgi:GT2 family glycosyltransferase
MAWSMSRPTLPPNEAPPIAVVVATHNRSALLPRLFAGLEAQEDVAGFEVIVVNDGSTDDTRVVLDHLVANTSVTAGAVHLVRNAGPATARNIGWRASAAPVLAFTDDDCVPSPRWLASLLGSIQTVDLVQGRTLPDPVQRESQGPFSRTLDIASEDGYYQTCNVAYRREVLEREHGFHEEFRFPAGEDTDLAWRAKEAGATTAFDADAVVFHDVPPSSFTRAVKDTWRWQSVALATKRHPGVRAAFPSRYVWRQSHLYAVGAIAGIATAAARPRSPLALAAAVALAAPYARYRGVEAPLPGVGPRRRWALVPAALAIDTAETLACLVGSARHKTFVL